jgi:hypothetical protein
MQWLDSWLRRVMCTALGLFFWSYWLGGSLLIILCLVANRVLWLGWVCQPSFFQCYYLYSLSLLCLFYFLFFISSLSDLALVYNETHFYRPLRGWAKTKLNSVWIQNWRENFLLKELLRSLLSLSLSRTSMNSPLFSLVVAYNVVVVSVWQMQLAAVAALCVQYEAEFRPNMSIVVKALQPLLKAPAPAPQTWANKLSFFGVRFSACAQFSFICLRISSNILYILFKFFIYEISNVAPFMLLPTSDCCWC